MKIGMFDSGIGGLTLLSKAVRVLPEEEYFYYADTDHVPYGTKSKDEIYEYSKAAVDFLLAKNVDIIVIACNTATSVSAERLRSEYNIPIIGIEPAVKPAVLGTKKRVLVLATPMTVKEKKLHDLVERLDDEHRVDMKALGRLPKYAEQGRFSDQEVVDYIKSELSDIDANKYAAVVIGCTHFNHFTDIFRDIFGDSIVFADGSEGTVRHLVKRVEAMKTDTNEFGESKPSIHFYESGRDVTDVEKLDFYSMIMARIK